MMTQAQVLADVNARVNTNGVKAITGAILNDILNNTMFLNTEQRELAALTADVGAFVAQDTVLVTLSKLYNNLAAATTTANNSWQLNGNNLGSVKTFGTLSGHDLPFITSGVERSRYLAAGSHQYSTDVLMQTNKTYYGTQSFIHKSTSSNGVLIAGFGGGGNASWSFGHNAGELRVEGTFDGGNSMNISSSTNTNFQRMSNAVGDEYWDYGMFGGLFKIRGVIGGAGVTDVLEISQLTGKLSAGVQAGAAQGSLSIGYGSGDYVDVNNTFFGIRAGSGIVSGNRNTGIGTDAMVGLTSGSRNVAVGNGAASSLSNDFGHVAIGWAALQSLTGQNNTADGAMNVAVGYLALTSNVSGSNNTAVGSSTLVNNTGAVNTAIGAAALSINTTGDLNTALGAGAGGRNNTGSRNSYMGTSAGGYNTGAGSDNVFVGYQAGIYNNDIGDSSGTVGGIQNVFLGASAGQAFIGNGSVIIGYQVGLSALAAVSNTLAIHNSDTATPLIYGNFSASWLQVNGDLFLKNNVNFDVENVGSKIMNIGLDNAEVINIGTGTQPKIINVGSQSTLLDQINIYGAVMSQEVTNLLVEDKLFTVNAGGAAASGFNAGFEVEENAVITGYFYTNSTRDGWDFKSPAIASYLRLSLASLTGNRTLTAPDLDGIIATTNGGQTFSSAVWQGTSISTTYTDAKIKGSATAGGVLFASATDTAATDTALLWDNTNKRLTIGTATPLSTYDLNIATATAAAGLAGISLTNTTANGFALINFGTDTNNRGVFSWSGSGVAGNITGTSVPFALSTRFTSVAAGVAGAGTIGINGLPVLLLAGTTGSNYGVRADATGMRIDILTNIHTSNTVPLAVGTVFTVSTAGTIQTTNGNLSTAAANGFQFLNGGSSQFAQISGLYLAASYGVTPAAGQIISNRAAEGNFYTSRVGGSDRLLIASVSGGHTTLLTGNSTDLRLGSTAVTMFLDSTGRVSIATSTAATKAKYFHLTAGATTNVSVGSSNYAAAITGSTNNTTEVAMEIKNSNTGITAAAILYLSSDTATGIYGSFSAAHSTVPNVAGRIAMLALTGSEGATIGTRTAKSIDFVTTDILRWSITGGGILTAADAIDMAFGTTTGTKIGTATTQKLAFWNTTPIVQPTTAVGAATFVTNTSLIFDDSATWDGYTMGQVVKALRNLGLLA